VARYEKTKPALTMMTMTLGVADVVADVVGVVVDGD
jgi:hypothetical protein